MRYVEREKTKMINAESMTIDDIEDLVEQYCSDCCLCCDECELKHFVRDLYYEIEKYNTAERSRNDC